MMNLENTSRAELILRARAKRALALREQAATLKESLTDFTQAAWPQLERKTYLHNWHIDAIAEHLEAVSRREIKRLIINVPFRTMKSTLVSVAWPAWVWANDPSHQFLCGSHAEKLATRDNLKHRRLVMSPWYRERWGNVYSLAGDQNQKLRFENDKGGYRIGFGMTSGITGDGGDTVIIDDPHDRDAAQSEAERTTALETFDQSVITRLNDPENSAIVVIMQRLHEEDLSGHLLNEGGWEHLMLPMEYDPARVCVTSLGEPDPRTEEGELLWPERFPAHTVASLARTLGPYGASGQLQQMPTPAGGGILKTDWWQPWGYDEAICYGLSWSEDTFDDDGNLLEKGRREFPEFSFCIASFDGAFGQKAENDLSALTIWGRFADLQGNVKFMLVNAWEERLPLHQIVAKIAATCKKYKVKRLLVEAKANGHDVASEIQRLYGFDDWGVELINPGRLDKVARAHSIVHLLAEGMIFAPDTSWSQKVINQCASFPKAAHDDLVDSCTMALRWLRDNNLATRNDEAAAIVSLEAANWKRETAPLYPGV
jgi:predicted phage terminase large subunit-like protein